MNHLQRYLVDEFVEDYQEGHLTRRQALKLLSGITGAAVAAQLLAACGQPASTAAPTAAPAAEPTAAPAAEPTAMPAPTTAPAAEPTAMPAATTAPAAEPTAMPAPTTAPAAGGVPNSVPADDPSIIAGPVEFPGSDATLMGYLARPAAEGTYPIVLVCHENRGLTPHIEDVARRAAKAGYVGLAVDLLSREGGTSKVADPAGVPGMLSGAPPARHVQDFQAGLEYLKAQPYAQGDRAGMVGFCFGGGVTWLVAAGLPELRAAVPFYGPPPPAEQLPNINAAVLAIYAGNDQRINGSIETVEPAMQAAGKTYQKIVYPGVDHAFNNDTGQRYNAEAAQAAWGETLAWFEKYVKG
jgi:carboxymethylenebutenolidase